MSDYVFPKLSPDHMISIIRNGLSKTKIPKKIIIVGAGMAGLVAASLLKQAGHDVTIPFSVLQFVDIEPYDSFSHNKWKAIRELHYAGSTKTGIQFKSKFWEKEGMYGGKTASDLPITYAQYPSHDLGTPGPGVILASYTWEDDAIPWDSLSDQNRLEYVLKNLATIHGKQVYREFETGVSHSWIRYPYSAGAFTIFKPEQATELSPYISSPEGRVHFAGEHTSTTHGWIQGAIESGIRVAYEVNDLPRTLFEPNHQST